MATRTGEHRCVSNEVLTGADFSGRAIGEFVSIGSRFQSCDFRDMRLKAAGFGDGPDTSEYVDCVFDGSRISAADGRARFVGCSFRGVDIRNWDHGATELIDCTFTGRLRKCVFYGVFKPPSGGPPRDNEFRDNDFSGADLIEVEFRWGVDLSRQRLPTGPDYISIPDTLAALAHVRRAVQDWPQPRRQHADDLLEIFDRGVALGQRQLFLRASEWVTDDGDAEFFQLLREAADPSRTHR
jgi:hypothetical protein